MNALEQIWPGWRLDLCNHLWQSTLVGLVFLLLIQLCHRFSAGTRANLAFLGILKFAIPVAVFTEWLPTGMFMANWPGVPPSITNLAREAPDGIETAPSFVIEILLLAWLGGTLTAVGRCLVRHLRHRSEIFRYQVPVPRGVARQFKTVCASVGVRRPPTLVCLDASHGPAVVGVRSPLIVLPVGLAFALERDELGAVMTHEVVHAAEEDTLWGTVEFFVAACFWFCPVVWILVRVAAGERERRCDEVTVGLTGDPESYAKSIWRTIRFAHSLDSPSSAGFGGYSALARVLNVTGAPRRITYRHADALAYFAGLLIIAASGWCGSLAPDHAKFSRWENQEAHGSATLGADATGFLSVHGAGFIGGVPTVVPGPSWLVLTSMLAQASQPPR